MRVSYIVGFSIFCLVFALWLEESINARAQAPRPVVATALPAPTPAPAAAPAAPPAYTETERLMVQLVQASDQLATCQQQLGSKNVAALGNQVQQRIEQAHPGFTVNWQTGTLVPKPPAK